MEALSALLAQQASTKEAPEVAVAARVVPALSLMYLEEQAALFAMPAQLANFLLLPLWPVHPVQQIQFPLLALHRAHLSAHLAFIIQQALLNVCRVLLVLLPTQCLLEEEKLALLVQQIPFLLLLQLLVQLVLPTRTMASLDKHLVVQ